MVKGNLPFWKDEWEPLWIAAEETGLPVQLHTVGSASGAPEFTNPLDYHRFLATVLTEFQMAMATHLPQSSSAGHLYAILDYASLSAKPGSGGYPTPWNAWTTNGRISFRILNLR